MATRATTARKTVRSARRRPLAPRKQPLQERAAHTVATLAEAAAQVLEIEGIEGFDANAIPHRAGVSVGSLYQYFPARTG